jgi:hypothetical protein
MLEERLADMEHRFERLETHFDEKLHGLELKMVERLSRVDQRMTEVERLLQSLVTALAPRSLPSGFSSQAHISQSSGSYVESYP